MLTPEQFKAHRFRSAGKGLYRSDEVDTFFEESVAMLKKMTAHEGELQKSNDELYQRVEALANALNQMRSERDLINKTMILAQKAADDTIAQAQEDSTRLLREARDEAERQRREAGEEASALLTGAREDVEKLLLEAQAHAENLQAKAQARADKLFEEARGTAQQELIRISGETQREQQELGRLRGETNRFRNALMEAVTRQMELIELMPSFEEEEPPEPAAPKAKRPEPVPVPAPAPALKPQPEPLPEALPLPEPEAELDEAAEIPALESADPFAELTAALEGNGSEFEEGFHFV